MKNEQLSILRIFILMIGASVVFLGLIGRLYVLQIITASETRASSEKSRTFVKTLPPTRGLLLDRHSRPLAQNTITYTVFAEKKDITDATAEITQLGTILNLTPSEIRRHVSALVKDDIQVRELQTGVLEEMKEQIEALNLPGIDFRPLPTRFYPEGTLASHVIGFTGTDNVGLAGLELTLNDKLEGTPQPIHTDKDIRQRMIAEDDYTKIMTRGVDYVLTLDSYIQYVVERELKNICEETGALQANAVVMHPGSGDILAFANYPTYDPNHYGDYSQDVRRDRLLVDVFEPGSVVKPFIMSAALEQGAVTPDMPFYCEKGFYYFRGHVIRDDIHHFETLSAHDVLVRSSNIGMVKIAQRLGSGSDDFRGQAKILVEYLKRFGFKNTGEKTIEDLPGESGGKLYAPEKWWPASIGAVPFGQGITTNTLILASAYSALANRGDYVKPRILLGKRLPDGAFQPIPPERPVHILSNTVANQVVQMMVDVTEDPEGTGRKIRIPGFHIAGKTGTAQKVDPTTGTYGRGMRIASFAGFFPAENPQAVIVVVVDEPKNKKYGGEVAGPVFLKVAQELVAYWGLSPTDKTDPLFLAAMENEKKTAGQVNGSTETTPFSIKRSMPIASAPGWSPPTGLMPDLTGLPIREAYVRLAVNGLKARFEGSGKVVNQPVPPGTPIQDLQDIGVVQCEPALTDPSIGQQSDLVVQR